MKRLVSLILCVIVCVSALYLPVSAAEHILLSDSEMGASVHQLSQFYQNRNDSRVVAWVLILCAVAFLVMCSVHGCVMFRRKKREENKEHENQK